MGKEKKNKSYTMEVVSTKAMWTVSAGVIPYHPKPQLTKVWLYTDEDFKNDKHIPPNETTRFSEIVEEVSKYQESLTDPNTVHWVHCDFNWM